MQDKKKIVIGALCALIMIMAVGYALLSQQLSITGSASITSNWQVEITNITEKEKSTGATTNNTNYTATTASFNTSLTSPGDYALYEVTVTNKGTLDAVLAAKPTVTTGNNEAIQYELEGIKKGDKILKNNQTDTFTIKVQYNPATTSQPSVLTSDIEVTLNYQQDLGQIVVYDEYSVGDVVEFAGSNWRVIKNSTDEEDYVTLMKEKVLTHNELGNYGVSHACTSSNIQYGDFGCTEVGQIVDWDAMPFYISDSCHGIYILNDVNYSSSTGNGCYWHNRYNESLIKGFLEGTYLSTIDPNENKLKAIEVGGVSYKVRLITLAELTENLGYIKRNNTLMYDYSPTNTPSWVYQGFGERENDWSLQGYWTMSTYPDGGLGIWKVAWASQYGTRIVESRIDTGYIGVRPVINLLKSAIE